MVGAKGIDDIAVLISCAGTNSIGCDSVRAGGHVKHIGVHDVAQLGGAVQIDGGTSGIDALCNVHEHLGQALGVRAEAVVHLVNRRATSCINHLVVITVYFVFA